MNSLEGFLDTSWTDAPDNTTKKISNWPLVVGVISLVLSFFVFWMTPQGSTTMSLVFGIVGYLLTPIASSAALVWARELHNEACSSNFYNQFSGMRTVKLCIGVAFLGFVMAFFQVLTIANYFGTLLAPGQ